MALFMQILLTFEECDDIMTFARRDELMQGGTLGQRLKAEMKKQRISSRALAGELQISRNRLNAILSDQQLPDYFLMVSMRKVLHLSTEQAMAVFFDAEPESTMKESLLSAAV